MDIQDQSKPTTTTAPSGHEIHTCHKCGWPFPNPHPSSKLWGAHKRICGTIEGYTKLIHSLPVSDDDHEHHSDSDDADKDKEKTPSPKTEKRVIIESGSSAGVTEKISNISKDGLFSDAVTETAEISEKKDQVKEDAHVLSVLRDIPLVDHAETLIEGFKDYDTINSKIHYGEEDSGNRSMVDTSEVKTAEENIHESQTSEHVDSTRKSVVYELTDSNLSTFVPAVVSEAAKVAETDLLMMSKTVPESTENFSKVEITKKNEIDRSVPILTEGYTQETIKESQNMVESVAASPKVRGKSEIAERPQEFIPEKTDNSQNAAGVVSETVLGIPKLMTSQDSGVDASIGSSSHSSLEGNWGSFSVLSTASEHALSINKSDISEDKSRLGKSDAFEGYLLEPKGEIVDQKPSKFKSITLQNCQPPISETKVGNETEGRKRNEEAISKVTNWSMNEQTIIPLKKLVKEANSSSPIKLSTMIQKDEPVKKTNEAEKSNLKHETPKVKPESAPPKHIGEDKKSGKKSKGRTSWLPFACCFSADVD